MKVKNKKSVVKAISAISQTHNIKRNKIKRLTEKKGKKRKKISKKALIEVGLKNETKKPKTKIVSITNDNLSKLTNISFKGTPENSITILSKQQKQVEGNKKQVSFIKRMKDKLKGARFRFVTSILFFYFTFDLLIPRV